MKVKLLDVVTGDSVVVDDPSMSPYFWAEGNWSCDSNRATHFAKEGEDVDDEEEEEHRCHHGPDDTLRYRITEVLDWHGEPPEWTLEELNAG